MNKEHRDMLAEAAARKIAILAFLERQVLPVSVVEIQAGIGGKPSTIRSCLDRLVQKHQVNAEIERARRGIPVIKVYKIGDIAQTDFSFQRCRWVSKYPLNHKRDPFVAAIFGERKAA